ncbi:MAG: thioredoxin family protein [Verrucomicrobiota bacterium]|nr:thioredoxin family protein [Verrucomicrobiota bacterium]
MQLKALLTGLLLLTIATLAHGEANWLTNNDSARATAKAEGKYLLLEFTGSDYCPPCKALARDLLTTPKFTDYATHNLVLLKLDFPKKTALSAEQRKHNDTLATQYKVEGFPTLILLDPQGKEVSREVGYSGDPAGVMAWLKKHVKGGSR